MILGVIMLFFNFFFFKQKTAYEMRISDWSSDVCSSDLGIGAGAGEGAARRLGALHLCEDALFKTLAETVEGRLDALDIAEVGTKAEDHDGPDGSSLRGAAGDAAISGHRPCVRPMAGDCCVSLAMTMAIILASPIVPQRAPPSHRALQAGDRKSTRLDSSH